MFNDEKEMANVEPDFRLAVETDRKFHCINIAGKGFILLETRILNSPTT